MIKMNKRYGIVTATCMVVGIVIGSGVFFKAQTVLQITDGDMPMGILAWIVGGRIMLSCILEFAVMASMYEKVNGVVDYAEATVGKKYHVSASAPCGCRWTQRERSYRKP